MKVTLPVQQKYPDFFAKLTFIIQRLHIFIIFLYASTVNIIFPIKRKK